jgi:hypothetical protein
VIPRSGAIALAFLCLAWGGASPARGQEALGAGIAENLAAGRSATDFSSRVRIRTGYWNTANDTKLVPTRLSGTWAPHPSVGLRLQLPLLYRNPRGANGEFGTSDLSARVLWRAWNHPRAAAFVGLELFFPTASDPTLGTEKYSISPIAAAFFPITKNFFFIPVYQQLISYAGDDDRADLNILRLRPILLAQWPRRWFTLLDPGFLWDLEDDLKTDDTLTLGLEVGKQVTDRITLSGKPGVQVYGTEDFAWSFDLSFTYRFE